MKYGAGVTNILVQTDEFFLWLKKLKDPAGRKRITERLAMARQGHFGDCRPVGGGVMEMRVHTGPGYRIYHARRGNTVYILLLGGDKRHAGSGHTEGRFPVAGNQEGG